MKLRTVALVSLALFFSILLAGAVGAPRALAQAGPAVPIPGPCIQIYPPPPGCGGGATITTDQPQYVIGAPIRICYTVPGPGPVTIIDQQPGGLSHTLLSAYDDGTGWCFPGTITPPSGTECLYLYFGGSSYFPGGSYGGNPAQACFQVTGSGGGGGCYGPVQTINATGGNSSVTLQSGQCFQLVLGGNYTWSISIDDPSVLSCSNTYPGPGQSVTCSALSPGYTTLRATGNPTCYPQCLLPSVLFQLSVNVF